MVADLLRVQALFFLANPFIALGHALLVRRLEFKRQSRIDLIAAALSALTAIACAYGGLGVWTLVAAPGALWFSRAIGYIFAARIWEIRPRFRFDGAGTMLRYGTAMVAVQACWFAQSQADIFIAGRLLEPHALGIYTTALVPDPDPGGQVRAAAERGRLRRLFADPGPAATRSAPPSSSRCG